MKRVFFTMLAIAGLSAASHAQVSPGAKKTEHQKMESSKQAPAKKEAAKPAAAKKEVTAKTVSSKPKAETKVASKPAAKDQAKKATQKPGKAK